jgi:hypothetical protein
LYHERGRQINILLAARAHPPGRPSQIVGGAPYRLGLRSHHPPKGEPVPDEDGDTARRLDLVEQRLDAMESRINTEASLRAMMDIDQASLTARLDAQDHLLRALAVTQSEHGTQLRKLVGEQTRLANDQTRLADDLHRTMTTVAQVEVGIRTIIGLLDKDG